MTVEELLEGHRRFGETFAAERERFVRLAEEGQSPDVLWIGCSDSRVIPEQIVGAGAGELFVIRNVGNMVPPSGTSGDAVGAVLEYAVLHLRVGHIVICGHTECGGIKALEEGLSVSREPHLARWVELGRGAGIEVEARGGEEEERYLATIKGNVVLQGKNVETYECVRRGVKEGRVRIHRWLYDLHRGELWAYDEETREWGRLMAAEGEA
jgi:carbonic anhydrase